MLEASPALVRSPKKVVNVDKTPRKKVMLAPVVEKKSEDSLINIIDFSNSSSN
jgi:hypothetical protein